MSLITLPKGVVELTPVSITSDAYSCQWVLLRATRLLRNCLVAQYGFNRKKRGR